MSRFYWVAPSFFFFPIMYNFHHLNVVCLDDCLPMEFVEEHCSSKTQSSREIGKVAWENICPKKKKLEFQVLGLEAKLVNIYQLVNNQVALSLVPHNLECHKLS